MDQFVSSSSSVLLHLLRCSQLPFHFSLQQINGIRRCANSSQNDYSEETFVIVEIRSEWSRRIPQDIFFRRWKVSPPISSCDLIRSDFLVNFMLGFRVEFPEM
ncbi:hypothetical protein Dimus_021788 [Dionaea muscipula]